MNKIYKKPLSKQDKYLQNLIKKIENSRAYKLQMKIYKK